MYCKEDSSEIISAPTECEDELSNEAENNINLEEVDIIDVPDEKNIPVKAVDEEDLLKQKYTIDDIVLPLPGSRVMYPANDVADVYHDLARKDEISLAECAHNVKEFSITSMSGAYRRVLQKPIDFEWELLKYRDPSAPLADTDLDILAKSESGNRIQMEGKAHGSEVNSSDPINVSDKCNDRAPSDTVADSANEGSDLEVMQTALKLSLTLPSSCYATMAIRELLKTSTSVAFHKTLNDQV